MTEIDHLEEKLSQARMLNVILIVVLVVVAGGGAWQFNRQRRDSAEAADEVVRQKAFARANLLVAEEQRSRAKAAGVRLTETLGELQATQVLARKLRRDDEDYRRLESAAVEARAHAESALEREFQLKKQLTDAKARIKELESATSSEKEEFRRPLPSSLYFPESAADAFFGNR